MSLEIVVKLVLLFTGWYVFHAIEYYLTSCNVVGNKYLFVFQFYWQEMQMYCPGRIGKHKRIKFIKDTIVPILLTTNNCVFGRTHMWSKSDIMIYGSQRYNEFMILNCFTDLNGRGIYFHIKNIILISLIYMILF